MFFSNRLRRVSLYFCCADVKNNMSKSDLSNKAISNFRNLNYMF